MVTVESALMLAHLHRELDAAKRLIAECEAQAERENETWTSSFEDRRKRPDLNRGRYIEIRIPSGNDTAYCPRMVSPALGLAVLRAHLAEVEAKIIETNEIIRLELGAPTEAEREGG